jgi:alkyl hydroperoxide reductase subunit F
MRTEKQETIRSVSQSTRTLTPEKGRGMAEGVKDPVCGMTVTGAEHRCVFHGQEHFFCSEGCKAKFLESPGQYVRDGVYDLVIVGGGPAGLTAAVYASVLRIHTLVVAKDIGGQAVDSTKIKNYMGFDFITGPELVEKFKGQFLHEHFLDHRIDEVIGIDVGGETFELRTRAGQRFRARSIIATGMKRRTLGIPGEDRLLHKGVSHSAVQDAALLAGVEVVVVGGGNSGIQAAKELLNAGCKVVLVEKGRLTAGEADVAALKQSGRLEVLERHDLIEIHGRDKVQALTVQSMEDLGKRRIDCRAVFIQVGLVPNTEFCQGLLDLNDRGEIGISPDCSTSVQGIFACGDVTTAFGKRIIIASGEGAKAALSAKQYLARIAETVKQ